MQSEFFREIEPGELYCKEFAQTCVRAGKSEARRAGWEAGNFQAGAELADLRENAFSLRKKNS